MLRYCSCYNDIDNAFTAIWPFSKKKSFITVSVFNDARFSVVLGIIFIIRTINAPYQILITLPHEMLVADETPVVKVPRGYNMSINPLCLFYQTRQGIMEYVVDHKVDGNLTVLTTSFDLSSRKIPKGISP